MIPSAERPLEIDDLGRTPYREAMAVMEQRVTDRLADRVPDALLVVEHPPVLTLGRAGRRDHVVATSAVLDELGIEVVETGRGGDVTYHGPGQVVGYPVLSLAPDRKDVRRYVATLEQVMIDVCAGYGLRAGRSEGQIGCWIEGARKVGAIGVRISKWVTSHGFAFNVVPDMTHFALIVPCGIADKPVTSLAAELGRAPPLDETRDRLIASFRANFR